MNQPTDPLNPDIRPGATIHGFRIERSAAVEELNLFCHELKHIATGARYFHLSKEDRENTFAVAFKTVPRDSTGVAHILEHTVLCGSARYPVRDPFFSMMRRSLSTFMNAFTASDWTLYPFSTENRKDFYNLLDVYLDASFFPRLDALSFKQEGHRLEFDEPDARLVYKGVVYNEMKGAMSSPDQVMVRSLMRALYPDTTYHYNSGGDPDEIPQLTHRQLKAFHRIHYHPSNAFFYTYGDLPLADHLAAVERTVLRHFTRIDPETDVPSQPRWDQPRQAQFSYPLSRAENPEKKCQACTAWLNSDIRDTFAVLAMSVLGQVLLGNSASPLRKALIDSGIGSALSDGSGYDADNRDTLFACGLKDVKASDAETVEAIVFDTLRALADGGIDASLVESALHQIEFHRKEVTNVPYPYGIKLLVSLTGCWIHGGDPVRLLDIDTDIRRLREEMSNGGFFESLIRSELLDNPHQVRFVLTPDTEMAERDRQRVESRLEQVRKDLSETEAEEIRRDAEALRRLQETQEDVSCLPTLELSDIPPSVKSIRTARPDRPTPALCFKQPTAGIFYFSSAAGVHRLSSEHLPLVPFFCHAATKMGTRDRDYVDLARSIDAHTGGLAMGAAVRNRFDADGRCMPFVSFNGKCLTRNRSRLFALMEELACRFRFADNSRLKSLLLEYRAGLEAMVVHQGHRLAISSASRNSSPAGMIGEMWQGVHHLVRIKKLCEDLSEAALTDLSRQLSEMAGVLFAPGSLCALLIGEAADVDAAVAEMTDHSDLAALLADPVGPQHLQTPGLSFAEEDPRDGWITSSSVSFVASVFPAVRLGHPDAPALSVLAKLLRSLYLHREIREKGGAYGGFAVYSPETGVFSFGSYRDPHIVETLLVYDNAESFMRDGSFTDQDVKEAILQECSDLDKPDPPGQAARKAFYRRLIGLTDEMRAAFKADILSLTRDRLVEAAETYLSASRCRGIAVISGEDLLKEANRKMGKNPLRLYRI